MSTMKSLRLKYFHRSIVILNIQKGVPKQKIRTIFERFGEIESMSTTEHKTKKHMLMAFIKYANEKAVKKALSNDILVRCRDIPLQIRRAFNNIDTISVKVHQTPTKSPENHRMKYAPPNAKKFAGFKHNCNCHHCVKTREKIFRGRLTDIMNMIQKVQHIRNNDDFERLSLKLMELHITYTKILRYYRHNH